MSLRFNDIGRKVNVIEFLDFELTYTEATVQHFKPLRHGDCL